MKKLTLTLLLKRCFVGVALVFGQTVFALSDHLLVSGTAKDINTGEVVYREYHDITPQLHTVRYVDPDNALIATKEIHYAYGYTTPEYALYDKRFDRRTGSLWQDGLFIIFKQDGVSKKHEKVMKNTADLVIDAGFDYFIRAQRAELLDGKVLPFTFVVADPLMALNMQLASVSQLKTAIPDKSERYHYFLASSRNRFIGWVIPDINLAYDKDSYLLMVYQGPSNLTDKHDKSQTVLIHYEYQNMTSGIQGELNP